MKKIDLEILQNGIKDYIDENELKVKEGGKYFSNVEYYGRMRLLNFFQKNGFLKKSNEKYSIDEIKQKINLAEKYNNLFEVFLVILKKEGFVDIKDGFLITSSKIDSDDLKKDFLNIEKFKEDLIKKFPDMVCHFNLLDICISNYNFILSGEKSADSVMFPVYSTHLVEGIFRGNLLADYFNILMAKTTSEYVKNIRKCDDERVIKIVEIGAGTGGTSLFVMDALKEERNVEFYFTDISKVFVRGNEKKYKEKYSFSIFKKLNVEESLPEQGFGLEEFDIVIATNVVHATKNINNTLKSAISLLNNDGILLLNEVTKVQDFTTLTFGLLGGWWHYEDLDKRLPNSPLLTIKAWESILKESGFNSVKTFSTSDLDIPDSFSQSLFAAKK